MKASLVVLLSLTAVGCGSAYYASMAMLGYQKAEILVDRVMKARTQQEVAKEQFQSTFDAFKELTNHDGGDLEKVYNKLKSEYERAEDEAKGVGSRIDSIEKVAEDLFVEWESDNAQINNPELRSSAEKDRARTRTNYEQLVRKMRQSEGRMAPVLTEFKDQVLYLKSHLNAAAIASLESQSVQIESRVNDLIAEMEQSIKEADEFIESLESPKAEA